MLTDNLLAEDLVQFETREDVFNCATLAMSKAIIAMGECNDTRDHKQVKYLRKCIAAAMVALTQAGCKIDGGRAHGGYTDDAIKDAELVLRRQKTEEKWAWWDKQVELRRERGIA